jgi:3-oxoacyl-(acyl-carrier-protein) synthase
LSKIFITGMGVISAIGRTLAENHTALLRGQCGIKQGGHLPTRDAGHLPFGEVPVTTEALQAVLTLTETTGPLGRPALTTDAASMHASAPGADGDGALGLDIDAAPPLSSNTFGAQAFTRTHLLALVAMQEAILDAGLTPSQLNSFDTALVSATTVGGMCLMDELYRDAIGAGGTQGSAFLSSYEAASVSMYLQSLYKINGIVNTINTACSSSANAIMYGARLIRNGLARRVLVGGVDSLSKFTINGFNALQILSPEICTPFDEHRKGLNLGEGAAFLVLEREEDIALGDKGFGGRGLEGKGFDGGRLAGWSLEGKSFDGGSFAGRGVAGGRLAAWGIEGKNFDRRGLAGRGLEGNDPGHKKIYASISGYGNSNDAFHPSSLSKEGEGPYLAMKEALASARLSPGKIDFINAHGTGTENNDEVESRAMLRLFGAPPAFASTKSNIGHTLGASGAIEAVYSILNLVHQEIYASLHFKEPIGTTGLRPVTSYQKADLQHVMSNSFGFGGNCTSLIFSKA